MAVDWRQDSVKAIREKKATAARAEALNTQTQVAVMAFCATATTITDAQALQMPDLFPDLGAGAGRWGGNPKDRIISKGGQLYRIIQQVTPLESQPPDGEGMLASTGPLTRPTPGRWKTPSPGCTAWIVTLGPTSATTAISTRWPQVET